MHSDEESAAGTYKRGFGFHPLLAYLDRDDGTGEALGGVLRAGNAGANTTVDDIDVFETSIDQLDGIDPARVLVRADPAGSSQAFLGHLGEAGVEFLRRRPPGRPGARGGPHHQSRPDTWTPAVRQDGQVRDGAHVVEITSDVDVSAYPAGTGCWCVVLLTTARSAPVDTCSRPTWSTRAPWGTAPGRMRQCPRLMPHSPISAPLVRRCDPNGSPGSSGYCTEQSG